LLQPISHSWTSLTAISFDMIFSLWLGV
jgi:hypothetical protein